MYTLLFTCVAVVATIILFYYCKKLIGLLYLSHDPWITSCFKKSRFDYFKMLYNKTCDGPRFVSTPWWKKPTRVVTTLSEATAFGKMFRRPFNRLRPMLKTLFHENDYNRWLYQRKLLAKNIFSPTQTDLLLDTINRCADEIILSVLKERNSSDPLVIDVVGLARCYINKILYSCVFDGEPTAEKDFVLWSRKLRNEESAMLKCRGLFGTSTVSEAEKYFQNLILSQQQDEDDGTGTCFLSALRRLFSPDPTVIESNSVSFILGGYTATVSTLVFTLYELTVNPKIQEKLCDKLSMGSEAKSYMNQILEEVLRKYPPFAAVIKVDSDDTMWVLPVSGLHHDPKIYPDPSRFSPERFCNGTPRFYFPFGIGKRKCPGAYFAKKVVGVFIEKLCLSFFLRPPPTCRVPQDLDFSKNKFTTSIDRLELLLDCNVKVK